MDATGSWGAATEEETAMATQTTCQCCTEHHDDQPEGCGAVGARRIRKVGGTLLVCRACLEHHARTPLFLAILVAQWEGRSTT